MRTNPEVEIELELELGTERFMATAVVTAGGDRDRLFGEVVKRAPVFGNYQQHTGRTLPVVELVRRG